eukprot:5388206-Amphidinium_carterae.1
MHCRPYQYAPASACKASVALFLAPHGMSCPFAGHVPIAAPQTREESCQGQSAVYVQNTLTKTPLGLRRGRRSGVALRGCGGLRFPVYPRTFVGRSFTELPPVVTHSLDTTLSVTGWGGPHLAGNKDT